MRCGEYGSLASYAVNGLWRVVFWEEGDLAVCAALALRKSGGGWDGWVVVLGSWFWVRRWWVF